jgi:Ca2+/Na+ antiporter
MNYLYIVSGFVILILGGSWLLKAAVSMSMRLKIPKALRKRKEIQKNKKVMNEYLESILK